MGWEALDQAAVLARRERARLLGLHVVSSEVDQDSAEVQALGPEFNRRCQAAGVECELAVEVGPVQRRVCDRARWADLVVLSLSHPPAPGAIATLGSGLTTIIRRCPRPVLTVPGAPSNLDRVLLAYDGSPKAEEALFIATYVAGRWNAPLVVLTVRENGPASQETLAHAQEYLEGHGVQADWVVESGSVAEAILRTAEAHGCDLILMGGYGHGPALEIVLGSAVDQVLRESRWPVLICR
jgi:nucleotide-binding universal stress UspA family protein